uniref:Uncharacterized protein n=1 Tax=Pyricularia oryzae (strain 70-15 / ATCC MYA-4617 / FGSC 8958) TaxID=242507 RepID=Q2KFI9_PYRO7|nr:hypothetical protein MGCH7_ch7g696 [Pyricularia oryzae 70-15]
MAGGCKALLGFTLLLCSRGLDRTGAADFGVSMGQVWGPH